MMEKTLVLLKPDAVQRGITGKIIDRFERKKLKILAMKMFKMDDKKAAQFYSVHKGKKFYNDLIKYITSGPIVSIVFEGEDAISTVRRLMGPTDPKNADPSTIRGKYGLNIEKNTVHGSDSIESAKMEIPIIFKENDFVKYKRTSK